MMFWLLLVTGIIGFTLAAYWDLKTTEFPDWLPYSMIVSALVIRGIFSWIENDIWILLNSFIFGVLFLAIGLGMYLAKQWGDGDAWLLGAMGFLFPDNRGFQEYMKSVTGFPFQLNLLFNFFLIAFIYLIIYSVILGIKNPKQSRKFFRKLKRSLKEIGTVVGSFSVICLGLAYYFYIAFRIPLKSLYLLLSFPVLLFCILIFMHYGRFIEKNLFRKKVHVNRLKPGDVLVSDKWRGLTEEEVKRLKKRGGYVWIKEGVRFAPVFLITILVTLFYGGLVWLFVV